MGYITAYTLRVYSSGGLLMPSDCYEQIRKLREIALALDGKEADIFFAIDEDGSCLQTIKWYEADYDMRRYSEQIPNVVFVLDGQGEDYEDIWRTYYLNGKAQSTRAEIVYEDFNLFELI